MSGGESDIAAYDYECETKRLIEECLTRHALADRVDYHRTTSLTVTRSKSAAESWKSKLMPEGIELLSVALIFIRRQYLLER